MLDRIYRVKKPESSMASQNGELLILFQMDSMLGSSTGVMCQG